MVKQGSGSLTLADDSSSATTGQKGTIFIDEGTVAVNPNSGVSGDAALGGNNAEVHLGGEFGTATTKFALTDADGGLSISRNILVRSGSEGTKTIAAENSSGTSTLSGGIFLDHNVTLSAASGGTLDLSGKFEDGQVVGGFAITVAGNGTVVFSGATNNTGVTGYTVQSGAKLSMNKSSADAVQSTLTVDSGGTAEFAASSQLGSSANIVNNGTVATGTGNITDSFNSLVSSGNITGNGTLTASTYTLSGGTVDADLGGGTLTVMGDTTLNGASSAGTVAVSGSGTELTLGASANRLATGADVTVALDSSIAFAADQTLASIKEAGTDNGGTLSIADGATLTINGANRGELFQNSISGAGGLTVAASGTTVLGLYGSQTYTGTTTVSGGKLSSAVAMSTTNITVSGGEFAATASDVVANTAAVTVNSGTYTVGGSDTIGALSGSGGTVAIGSGNTLTTSFNSAANSYSGGITGDGAFTKAGSGTLTLSGVNTKTGANTVAGGRLVVNGQLAGATAVTRTGATLSGSGSVGVTTVGNGGTINPGNSPGTLSLTNGFVMAAGGNYNWEIFNADDSLTAGQTNTWDLISVSGGAWDITGLNSTNKFNINLWSLSSVSPDVSGNASNFMSSQNYLWEILTFTSLNGTFSQDLFTINSGAFNGTDGFANNVNGGVFSLAVDGDSLNLLFTAAGGSGEPIPEPGTWAAAALLAGAAGYVRWRRRKDQKQDA